MGTSVQNAPERVRVRRVEVRGQPRASLVPAKVRPGFETRERRRVPRGELGAHELGDERLRLDRAERRVAVRIPREEQLREDRVRDLRRGFSRRARQPRADVGVLELIRRGAATLGPDDRLALRGVLRRSRRRPDLGHEVLELSHQRARLRAEREEALGEKDDAVV
eukprot:527-Pelagococcus_subviridis.AAC.1